MMTVKLVNKLEKLLQQRSDRVQSESPASDVVEKLELAEGFEPPTL
jgi:hypothetical protein